MPTNKKTITVMAKNFRKKLANAGIKIDFVLSKKLAKAVFNEDVSKFYSLGGNYALEGSDNLDDCYLNFYYKDVLL